MLRRLGAGAVMWGCLWGAAADSVIRESPIQLNIKGTQMYATGRWKEAEAFFRRALAIWPADLPGRPVTVSNLGATLRAMGRYDEAEPLLCEALRELEKFPERDATPLSHTLTNLAGMARARGDLAAAEEYAKRAAAVGTQKDRADARLTLASIYIDGQRHEEAEALLSGDMATARGESAAVLYNDLASAAVSRGDFARGQQLAQRALGAADAVPPGHPLIAAIRNNLAQAFRFQENYLEAESNYRAAIEIWKSALGPDHPDVARGLLNLAEFYHDRERESGAEDLLRRASDIFARSLGTDRVETLIARNELGEVLRAEHRYTESERWGHPSLLQLKAVLQAGDARLKRALMNYARLLRDTKREKELETVLVQLAARP